MSIEEVVDFSKEESKIERKYEPNSPRVSPKIINVFSAFEDNNVLNNFKEVMKCAASKKRKKTTEEKLVAMAENVDMDFFKTQR